MYLPEPKTPTEGKKSPREVTTGNGAGGRADFRPPPLVQGIGRAAARRERHGRVGGFAEFISGPYTYKCH